MSTTVARADGVMDRAYRRFGWRLMVGYALLGWAAGYASLGVVIVAYLRLREFDADQVRELISMVILAAFAQTAVSTVHTVRALRPLRRFELGQLPAEQAWGAVVGLPVKITRASLLLIALGVSIGFPALAHVDTLSVAISGLYVFAAIGVYLYGLATTIFLAPIFLRPALRAMASTLDAAPPLVSGILLTTRLWFVVPAFSVAVAVVVSSLGFSAGQNPRAALTHLGVATVVAAASTIPITMLLAKAVRDPIEDLLEGTKRVQAADYSTPVPELSNDELGKLARSFNDAMAGLADRQRLSAENVRLLDEVRASRARIVAASDASRRRVERNLHDGAQQRLVALALDLRLLEETATAMPIDDVVEAIQRATEDVKGSLAELRELARGLHPTVLTTDGLSPALQQLAARSTLPVTVSVPERRFPQQVETAAYFVAAEALTNVAKYARACLVSVSVRDGDGRLVVRITDDGIGGASLGNGSGLAGLADRVAALDGTLTIDSPVGRGTTVVAELPTDGVNGADSKQLESRVG